MSSSPIRAPTKQAGIDKLNQAGNPPLQDLSALDCASRFGSFERGEMNGRSVYQIKERDKINPLYAILNNGQVKWSSTEEISLEDIEQVIEFTVDNNRSLLINGGTHGTETGETVCDNPELGDTKILLEVAEKIDEQQAFLHVAFHVVSEYLLLGYQFKIDFNNSGDYFLSNY
mgnify:CR=1 FL=1